MFGRARIPAGPGWKTHELRDRTIRLARAGMELMRGGYLDLLRYPQFQHEYYSVHSWGWRKQHPVSSPSPQALFLRHRGIQLAAAAPRPSLRPRRFDCARSTRRPAAALSADSEAARFLGLSGRTLEKHRTYGTGPRKIGARVVYALDDLKA